MNNFPQSPMEKRRRELGRRQKEIAAIANVSPVTVSRFERGEIVPSLLKLYDYCRAYKWTPDELFQAVLDTRELAQETPL